MNNFSVDKLIGETLIARKNIAIFDFSGKPITYLKPGDVVGTVFSWITKPKFRLMFYPNGDTTKPPFFTTPELSAYEITPKMVVAAQQEQDAIDQQIIESKGAIPFYIDKYGSKIALLIIGIVVTKEVIKKWKP